MFRSFFMLTSLVVAMGLASGCADSHAGKTAVQRITLTGSSTVAPLMLEMGKRFERQHSSVRVDVQTGGSSRGLADARRGLADIGMVSRDLKPTESDLLSYPVALDGIGLLVHKTNPITNIQSDDVRKIYLGQIKNWTALGGADKSVVVVNKAEGRSTLELFLKFFKLKNSQIKPTVIIGDNEQGIKTVAANPAAIGYVSIGAAVVAASYDVPVKVIPLDGVEASLANVQKGTYPLMRTLNLVRPQAPEGLLKTFVDFSQSSQVHDLIEDQSLVSIKK